MGREKTLFAPLTKGGGRGYNSQAFDFEELMRVCWNRQTGKLEVLVFDRTCGFKSHHSHHSSKRSELNQCARVVELADSLDSGSSAHYGRAGSSPASRTKQKRTSERMSFFAWYSGRKRQKIAVQPTTSRKYERLRDGFLADGVRAANEVSRSPASHLTTENGTFLTLCLLYCAFRTIFPCIFQPVLL